MKWVTSVVALFICAVAHGQETTINVLAVQLPPGAYTSQIQQQMASLAQYWPNANGVTVTLVNGGSPVYLSTGIGSGDVASQLQAAKDGLVAANLRGVADIVLFFSPYVSNVCGHAPMTNWNAEGRHAFLPDDGGMDLDGADTYYAGIINLTSCPPKRPFTNSGICLARGIHSRAPVLHHKGPTCCTRTMPGGSVLRPRTNTCRERQLWLRAESVVIRCGSSVSTQVAGPTILPA